MIKISMGIWTSFLVLAGSVILGACSNNEPGLSGGNTVAWTDNGTAFNGAFGWDTTGVTQTALLSGTSCDSMDSSVDIVAGQSQDPCLLESNSDGSPFNGTIAGTVCNSDNDTQTAHTVTCLSGFVTASTQDINSTPTPAAIVMFQNANLLDGAFGGRTQADTECVNSKPVSVTQTNVRAFISISGTDEIRDMPANYSVPTNLPIQSTTGTLIANNWADLLDGSIMVDLQTAGVIVTPGTGGFVEWWSGSNADGSVNANTCSNWTSTAVSGHTGRIDATGSTWLDLADLGCSADQPVVCIAF